MGRVHAQRADGDEQQDAREQGRGDRRDRPLGEKGLAPVDRHGALLTPVRTELAGGVAERSVDRGVQERGAEE